MNFCTASYRNIQASKGFLLPKLIRIIGEYRAKHGKIPYVLFQKFSNIHYTFACAHKPGIPLASALAKHRSPESKYIWLEPVDKQGKYWHYCKIGQFGAQMDALDLDVVSVNEMIASLNTSSNYRLLLSIINPQQQSALSIPDEISNKVVKLNIKLSSRFKNSKKLKHPLMIMLKATVVLLLIFTLTLWATLDFSPVVIEPVPTKTVQAMIHSPQLENVVETAFHINALLFTYDIFSYSLAVQKDKLHMMVVQSSLPVSNQHLDQLMQAENLCIKDLKNAKSFVCNIANYHVVNTQQSSQTQTLHAKCVYDQKLALAQLQVTNLANNRYVLSSSSKTQNRLDVIELLSFLKLNFTGCTINKLLLKIEGTSTLQTVGNLRVELA